MLLHHVFTVLLLSMAYVINGVQIGTLIMLAHDISDVPLEVRLMIGVWLCDHVLSIIS